MPLDALFGAHADEHPDDSWGDEIDCPAQGRCTEHHQPRERIADHLERVVVGVILGPQLDHERQHTHEIHAANAQRGVLLFAPIRDHGGHCRQHADPENQHRRQGEHCHPANDEDEDHTGGSAVG
jgi:hypothetical protein